jgi:hypothetical protein
MTEQMELIANPVKEVLDELFTLLEGLETHSEAVLQFLKDQGITTEEKLAPYLERAGNATSVKWRAARVRMEYLLSPIQKETKDKDAEKPKTEKVANETLAADKSDGKPENISSEKDATKTGNAEPKDANNQERKHEQPPT